MTLHYYDAAGQLDIDAPNARGVEMLAEWAAAQKLPAVEAFFENGSSDDMDGMVLDLKDIVLPEDADLREMIHGLIEAVVLADETLILSDE